MVCRSFLNSRATYRCAVFTEMGSCNFSKIIDRAIFCFSACKRLKQHFCGVWAYKIRSFAIFASCIEKSLCTILRANICKLYPKVFLKESKPKSRKQRHKPHKSALKNKLSYVPPASIPATKLALQVVIAFV